MVGMQARYKHEAASRKRMQTVVDDDARMTVKTSRGDADMAEETKSIAGVAEGVPFLAFPPAEGSHDSAPLVVAWHLMDAPRTEAALAAALPLRGLNAWKVYLGLPMMSSRLPDGGFDEVIRLSYADVVLNVYKPVFEQALSEFPAVLANLRQRFGIGDVPLALIGGSAGAAVAQLVALEAGVDARALVLISPVTHLRKMVDAESIEYGMTYEWSPEALEAARRIDFAARAGEFAAKDPAVLIVVGADDSAKAFVEPARELHEALRSVYSDPARVALEVIPDMGHAFAEQPGDEPAPQIPAAVTLDGLASAWLGRWV